MWGRPNEQFDHRQVMMKYIISTTIIVSPYRDRVIGTELKKRTGCGVSSIPRPNFVQLTTWLTKYAMLRRATTYRGALK